MVETQADNDNNSDQFRCIEIKDTDQGILLCKNVKKSLFFKIAAIFLTASGVVLKLEQSTSDIIILTLFILLFLERSSVQ